uniref:interleukin-17C-like n=1 Tax=Scatophagus argus TaxID=75038 RepID=UPI001ED83DC1|nr:interleukin-17C-like [Scatophagus argus]
MLGVSQLMLGLGSLLIFNHRASSTRCVDVNAFNNRATKLQVMLKSLSGNVPLRDATTCEQAAREMRDGALSHRALSPWKFSQDRDNNRFPPVINVAECLCRGCIINQREELSYNSVPVYTTLMVLRKTRCPSDSSKYEVKKDFIRVPVACTCAVPKYG